MDREKQIRMIAKEMDIPSEPIEGSIIVEDEDITTRNELSSALKNGEIPGNAIVEWEDKAGIVIRANVVDFVANTEISAYDAKTMEKMQVPHTYVPDGSWRLLY